VSKLQKKFPDAEWKECCGSFCKDCKIASAYRNKFGKKEGEKKLKKDKKKS
jgi:hypothetical protein